jgi:CRP/FNR family transcriptional regulator
VRRANEIGAARDAAESVTDEEQKPVMNGSRSSVARAEAAAQPDQWATATFAELAATLSVAPPRNPRLAKATFNVRQVKAGEAVHRAGDKFEALYVVRAGCVKTVRFDGAGNAQVLGFPMVGDVVGLDAADLDRHTADTIALDAGAVIVVPFERLERLACEFPAVGQMLHRLFGREVVHKQQVIWMLGRLGAEARVAAFLLQMSDRFGELGYSRTSLMLRMSRKDMGSYLGLKLETVSRTLSAFAAAGLVAIDGKSIELRDLDALHDVMRPKADDGRAKRLAGAQRPAARTVPSPRVVQ